MKPPKVITNPATGASHGALTDLHRNRLAEALSLCTQLTLIPGDPRKGPAAIAAEALRKMLETAEPTIGKKATKTGKDSPDETSKAGN